MNQNKQIASLPLDVVSIRKTRVSEASGYIPSEKEKNDPTEGPKVNPNILTNSNDKDIERIKEQIKELNTGTRVTADFVVQLDNYQDLPKFKSICAEYGISYTLQKMWNWGTWPIDEFEEKNIYNINHLQYQNLLKYL